MALPSRDRDYLVEKGYIFDVFELEERGPKNFLIIYNWKVPVPHLSANEVTLLIVLPDGYSAVPPDMFYTNPVLTLNKTRILPYRADRPEKFLGTYWQMWSRHINRSTWRPECDCIKNYLRLVDHSIAEAFKLKVI